MKKKSQKNKIKTQRLGEDAFLSAGEKLRLIMNDVENILEKRRVNSMEDYKHKQTNEQKVLERLIKHQAFGFMHPLTCGNNSAHILTPKIIDNKVTLVCPDCDYVQDYIPEFFLTDSYDEMLKEQEVYFAKITEHLHNKNSIKNDEIIIFEKNIFSKDDTLQIQNRAIRKDKNNSTKESE